MRKYRVINGWVMEAPLPRADKNWLAVITAGGKNGVTRAFLPQGQKGSGMLFGIGPLKVGDALEWGADEVKPIGNEGAERLRHRQYEVVIGKSFNMLFCREFPTAILAINASALCMEGRLPEEAVFDRIASGYMEDVYADAVLRGEQEMPMPAWFAPPDVRLREQLAERERELLELRERERRLIREARERNRERMARLQPALRKKQSEPESELDPKPQTEKPLRHFKFDEEKS